MPAYLIFVMNAVNAVCVNFWLSVKKNTEERQNFTLNSV